MSGTISSRYSPLDAAVEPNQSAQTLKLDLKTSTSTQADIRPVYVVGNFNDWKTEDERFLMRQVAPGHYIYVFGTVADLPQPLEYKYVKGGWENQELDVFGELTNNRILEQPQDTLVVHDTVPRWMNYGLAFDPKSLPKRRVISESFLMPQLNRKRRVEIWLPHDYDSNIEQHYPVLYLQDGQNLANPHSSYGNWAIDQRMAVLAEQQQINFIVVSIEHGGVDRLREYSPSDDWGKKYALFLVETLKPYIDTHFRTKKERIFTCIGGSSLGGLISAYSGLHYADVFGRMLIFSPWVLGNMKLVISKITADKPTRIYLYGGGQEGANMLINLRRLRKQLLDESSTTHSMQVKMSIDPKGQHTEARWGQEFLRAIEWLFDGKGFN
jgi:predicted alpha/beta superfamily hydrolase